MTRTTQTALAALASAALLTIGRAAGPPPPAALPAPVHENATALEQAILDATRAFMHGDTAAARSALDRAEEACRRVGYDDLPAAWPKEMVNDDVAMHSALDRARESTSRGQIDPAVDSLVWVERTCRECHAKRDGKAAPPSDGKPHVKPDARPVR